VVVDVAGVTKVVMDAVVEVMVIVFVVVVARRWWS